MSPIGGPSRLRGHPDRRDGALDASAAVPSKGAGLEGSGRRKALAAGLAGVKRLERTAVASRGGLEVKGSISAVVGELMLAR